MKKHSGMRPQDIVILLKIASIRHRNWLIKDVANDLGISQSETSESLYRSAYAGLVSADKKQLMRKALLDFLIYGLKYVYPQRPGPIVRGMPTAHSAPPLNKMIQSEEIYVWPSGTGEVRGQLIEPLHSSVVEACKTDPILYEYLSLIDAIRVGRVREQQLAIKELTKRLLKNA